MENVNHGRIYREVGSTPAEAAPGTGDIAIRLTEAR